MNKENITHKKINSPWNSPSTTRKQQLEKWKEQYLSNEKRGLHLKSFSDNIIPDTNSKINPKKAVTKKKVITKDVSVQVNEKEISLNYEKNAKPIMNNIINKEETEIKKDTQNQINIDFSLDNIEKLKIRNQKLEERISELENNKDIKILALEQDLSNRDQYIEQLQKKIQSLEKESLQEGESICTADTSINYEGLVSELEKENKELMEDLKSCQEVIEALEERENWIPPEEFEQKVLEEVLNQQSNNNSNENNNMNNNYNNSKSKSKSDGINEKGKDYMIISETSKNIENDEATSSYSITPKTITNDNYEVLIDELKKKIEKLTVEVKEKSEENEKVIEENKELYKEIKDYHEVISLLEERENWTSPEDVEKIRLELYQVVVEKGFIESELEETKEIVRVLKNQWIQYKIENEKSNTSYLR